MGKYICIEGMEGTGKGTQIKNIEKELIKQGKSVLITKEPGTPLLPFTMELRKYILDAQYSKYINGLSTELGLLFIRSIHINNIIKKELDNYDYILQDRGIYSGLAYGAAKGINLNLLIDLNEEVINEHFDKTIFNFYDQIILLSTDNAGKYLKIAQSAKQEYEAGDAIENLGKSFMDKTNGFFNQLSTKFKKIEKVSVESNGKRKTESELLKEIMSKII